MQRNYIVTLDGSSAVFMRGPPIIEDTGDSSSDNQRSEGGSGTLENTDKATSNYSTFEDDRLANSLNEYHLWANLAITIVPTIIAQTHRGGFSIILIL